MNFLLLLALFFNQRGVGEGISIDIDNLELKGDYYALVMGARNDSFGRLRTVENDVAAVTKLLKDFGFEVLPFETGSKQEILNSLRELQGKVKEDDHLLIYFAGHGKIDARRTTAGWLIPSDGDPNDNSTWVDNSVIMSYLKESKAKHLLFVSDSCYSGVLFDYSIDAREYFPTEKYDNTFWKQYSQTSRWGLSSGRRETVADDFNGQHSPFAHAFLSVLRELDRPFISLKVLFERIKQKMEGMELTQKPMLGKLKEVDRGEGMFFFIKNQPEPPSSYEVLNISIEGAEFHQWFEVLEVKRSRSSLCLNLRVKNAFYEEKLIFDIYTFSNGRGNYLTTFIRDHLPTLRNLLVAGDTFTACFEIDSSTRIEKIIIN